GAHRVAARFLAPRARQAPAAPHAPARKGEPRESPADYADVDIRVLDERRAFRRGDCPLRVNPRPACSVRLGHLSSYAGDDTGRITAIATKIRAPAPAWRRGHSRPAC